MQVTVLSMGAGQDSTALLYKYLYDPEFRKAYAPDRFLVLMSDTGDEHRVTDAMRPLMAGCLMTLDNIAYMQRICEKHCVEFVYLTPEKGYHTESWQSLQHQYDLNSTCGSRSGFKKTCTDNLKVKPIYRFLETWLESNYGYRAGGKRGLVEFARHHGRIRVLIGIAKGEEKRMMDPSQATDKWRRQAIETLYPLVDLGMDRAACQSYIRRVGHPIPFPSNCRRCPYMTEQELLWLWTFDPETYEDWVRQERNKLERFSHIENNYGVFGLRPLPEILTKAQEKYGHLSPEELFEHKLSHEHCVASKY